MTREFITAAKEAAEVDEGIALTLDGRELRAYKPTGGQYAMFMATTNGRWADSAEKMAATIDFVLALFAEDDARHLGQRLMDRTDDFEVEDLMAMVNALTEEWAGRPTRPSTGSTRSRPSGGRKSTAATLVATS
jgi:hypothetical protein